MKVHPLLTATAASLISLGVGGVLGYKIAERNLALRFEERLHHEIAASTAFYEHNKDKAPAKKFATPEEAAAALIKPGTVLVEKPQMPMPTASPEQRVAYHKIASNYVSDEEKEPDPDDQLALQIMFPEPPANNMPAINVFTDGPHVIDQATFIENKTEWDQSTLTWYIVDGTLTDDRDHLVEDVDGTVGNENLLRFGEGSSDPNVVHVRNPRLNLEFEVVRHEGSYRREVLGIDEDPPQRPSGRD